jgi:putative membrane protein
MRPPKFSYSTLAAAVLAFGLPLAAAAQATDKEQGRSVTPPPGATTSSATARTDAQDTTLPAADRQFMDKAAIAGMAEIEMGRLAQQKASNDQVKQFGQRMVEDHGKANSELKQVASDKGVELPTSLDPKHQQAIEKLQKLSGTEFDRAYMTMMVEDHTLDVAEFDRQTTIAQNEKLRQFAQKSLPILQEHLKLAKSIQGQLSGGKRAAGKAETGSTSGGHAHSSGSGAAPKTPGSTSPNTTSPGMKGSGTSNPTGTDSKQ